ncbi:MAG TPA: hypothetical protein VGE45_10150 [Chloroflexia bacterium]
MANLLGGTVVYLAGIMLLAPLGGDSAVGQSILYLLVAVGIGAVLGLAQWQVLHDQLPTLPRRVWVAATGFGLAVPLMLVGFVGPVMAAAAGVVTGWRQVALQSGTIVATLGLANSFPEALAAACGTGAVAGVMLGAIQWLALRRYVQNAAWWVAANMAGGAVGMLAGLWVGIVIVSAKDNTAVWLLLNMLVGGPGVFILSSTVTGATLVALFHRSSTNMKPTATQKR